MASVVARMWSSLNEPLSADPRCPEVPKATCWPGPPGPGPPSYWALPSRSTSNRADASAGRPARSFTVICAPRSGRLPELTVPGPAGRKLGPRTLSPPPGRNLGGGLPPLAAGEAVEGGTGGGVQDAGEELAQPGGEVGSLVREG